MEKRQQRPSILDPAKQEERRAACLDASARRSLKRIERLQKAAAEADEATTEWENTFLSDVGERIEKFGRAFADPDKGSLMHATSIKQSRKLREIHRSLQKRVDK